MTDRAYDLVLFGATGFTGGLAADYLAAHVPPGGCWAIAGRSAGKLEAVRARLGVDVDLLVADAADPAALGAIAASTRVVLTTVGPYLMHGEPLVGACAATGTDYLDLSGEPEFVDRMYLAHHRTAVATGSRLVHAGGFDSVPHDIGALFTVKQLPAGVPLSLRGVVRADAAISGGTLHSALGQFARARQLREARAARREVEPRPPGRRSRPVGGHPHRDRELGLWLVPLPTIDPLVVARSGSARDDYGPDFRYSHYAGLRRLTSAVTAAGGLAAVVAAAQVGPARRLVGRRLAPGSGPSPERRARSRFSVDFIGEGGGCRVHTRVHGGDPGYTETAMMLAEGGMSLAFDDNPPTAGQVTTATAMGESLLRRLVAAGLGVDLVAKSGR